MNNVMRTLTVVTIIMMFPTLVAGLFGMNLINGMEESNVGFVVALIISVGGSALTWLFLKYKRLI